MTPLIDGDILRYEIGAIGEYIDEETGEKVVRNFDFVAEQLDQKISEICAEVWATKPPIIYLSNDKSLHKKLNKRRKKEGKKEKEYSPNFREKVAVTKGYKQNRKKSTKPFHFDNITAYIMANYDYRIAEGFEADDLMSIDQYRRLDELDTIICSRDKDLRITPGMHFGWPCGKQKQFGPTRVSELGELSLKNGKIRGTGLKFFYSQLITGDTTDNIPGLPRGGPALADKLLTNAESEEDLFEKVVSAYEQKLGEDYRPYLEEQAKLLWMVREVDEDGNLVHFKFPDER